MATGARSAVREGLAGVTGKAWYGHLRDEPGLRRSILVWLAFAVPFVILSRLSWLESVAWWAVLGLSSLLIALVTVAIVHATSRTEGPDPATRSSRDTVRAGAGSALVASMTTWAIAWLLILSTLVPDQTVRRSGVDTAWSLVGLVIFGMAVLLMCGAIGAVVGSSHHALSGVSWAWNQITGRDILGEKLAGPAGLALALVLSVAAITGWLWLLTQAMGLAMSYAGWSH
jgi:hypothetical protein